MVRKYFLPFLAVGLLAFAVQYVARAQKTTPQPAPPVPPPTSPFSNTVAGAGIIEPQTENISVGSALPGVVTRVLVRVGQTVPAGAPLFQLDEQALQAELKFRAANLKAAQAQLTKLEKEPRPEELPATEARFHEAEANLAEQEDQLKRTRTLYASRSVSVEELVKQEQATRAARMQLARAQADYELLKAGAWEPDKEVARTAVLQAQAQLEQTRTDLDRLVVRALVEGEVLQVNVRPGEFVGAPPGQALIVLGNIHKLHVRVDIDENDIPRFRTNAPAMAVLRGNPKQEFPLTFVRVEPYVIPKRSLTGDNTERVDTRVLQVIYALDPQYQSLYVGQQVDVFINVENQGPEVAAQPVKGPEGASK